MKNEKEFYETTDFLRATLLMYFNHQLWEVDKSRSKFVFVFKKKKNTEELLDKFYQDKIKISPQKFFDIQKQIKGRIYS